MDESPPSQRWKSVLRVILFMAGCPVMLIVAGMAAPKTSDLSSLVALGAVSAAGTLALTWFFARWDGLKLADAGASVVPSSWRRLAFGFALGLILVGAEAAIIGLSGHIHWVRAPEIGFSKTGLALIGFLLLASREELAFRGYPLRRLATVCGPYLAWLLTAFIFAAEHLAGGYTLANALLGAAVGALLFGMAALATRGLAVPIGLHTAWNFGQWVLGNTQFPGPWQRVFTPGFEDRVGQTEMISYVLVMALAILAFWQAYKCQPLGKPS